VASNLSRFQRWAKRLVGAKTIAKRTEITIETERTLVIRRRRIIRAWCRECGCDVEMVSLGDVGAMTGMSQTMLHDSPEAQNWHFGEGQDGSALVCLESFLKSM
jgi:hypothetical protein